MVSELWTKWNLWHWNWLWILNGIRTDRLSWDYNSFIITEYPTSCHAVKGFESIFPSKILFIRSSPHSIPLYIRLYVSSMYVHYTHFSRLELLYLFPVDILQNSNFVTFWVWKWMDCLSAPLRALRGVKNEHTHCGWTMYRLGVMDKVKFMGSESLMDFEWNTYL